MYVVRSIFLQFYTIIVSWKGIYNYYIVATNFTMLIVNMLALLFKGGGEKESLISILHGGSLVPAQTEIQQGCSLYSLLFSRD